MSMARHEPIPLPPQGTLETVPDASDTVFNWDYEVGRDSLLNLYEKGKRLQWNASTDIDWSIDVDPERFPDFLPPEQVNALLNPPEKLEVKELVRVRTHQLGWMLSQFLHGEQGALLATAQIVNTVPWVEAKFYAASQVADEARHVEVYRRYLTEKLPFAFPVNPHLHTLLAQIIREPRWDMTYLGMQIMVEGLALAAFGLMNFMNPQEPLIQQITGYVIRDEARHVAFGVLSLEEVYRQMTAAELRERLASHGGDSLGDQPHVRRLVSPPAVRDGCEVRGVGLDEQAVERNGAHRVAQRVGVLEGHDAGHRDRKAEVQVATRVVPVAGETVDH